MLPILRPSSVHRRRSLLLVLLCAVQGVERFAFLAMLPLFVLYAQDRHAIPAPTALLILAIFQALSYLGGWPSGWLADRKLGARAATVLGAALLACGYAGLALDRPGLLWPALGLMVAGHSLFRPGLHVLLGSIAATDEYARERTFLWHYLAANVGYVAGALFGEWAHARRGWTWLFAGAAAASAVGVALLAIGIPWMRRGDAGKGHAPLAQLSATAESAGMRAVWLLCGVAVVFWLTAQQAGSSLTVFAATNTITQVTVLGHSFLVGPGHFASLHGLIVLALLPVFLLLHGRQQAHATSTIGKMVWGYVATAAAFVLLAAAGLHGGDDGRVSSAWLVGCYVFLSLAEVLLAPLGVSLLTRLAPKDKAAQAVGLWFAGCAVGNGLAGALGLCWDRWPHHRYFALLAALSLGAAAVLVPRRRQLDWLTALSRSTPSQPAQDERGDTMTAIPEVTTNAPASGLLTHSPATNPVALVLASMAIMVPGAVAVVWSLPLPVRGASAIVSGLVVLLYGPHLFCHALARWAGGVATSLG